MEKDEFQWVLRGDLIPRFNYEDLCNSIEWHYGVRNPNMD